MAVEARGREHVTVEALCVKTRIQKEVVEDAMVSVVDGLLM